VTNEIGMTPEYLGRVRLGASIASLVGVWLYQRFLRDVPIHQVLKLTTLASVPVRPPTSPFPTAHGHLIDILCIIPI
jgi:hypothetical protein